jgi:hypothetical protein
MEPKFDIVIQGHIPPGWSAWLDGMEVVCLTDGTTCISGRIDDQSALFGLLLRLRDFGLNLVSINPTTDIESEKNDAMD